MSNVAYVVSNHVKHLAAWTRDRANENGWATGAYRPLCGERLRHPQDTCFVHSKYEDPRLKRRAARVPLCKRCERVLAELVRETWPEVLP